MSSELWAIVLAAGDGTRLAPLTRALYGQEVPKQFAALAGESSLLQATIERISPLVPYRRIVVVVGVAHQARARAQLARYPGLDLVFQPRNLETAPGILLPLTRILVRAPEARVAIFPADHHVPDPAALLDAVELADRTTRRSPSTITLIGAVPDAPESEYGWIVPGPQLDRGPIGVRAVAQFVEKPPADVAQQLMARGGLWNTFISIGQAATFWALAKRLLPVHVALFEEYAAWFGATGDDPGAGERLHELYAKMPPASFSRAVLEHAGNLAVVPMAASGWCDWGSPERVFQSLHGTPAVDRLLQRIADQAGWLLVRGAAEVDGTTHGPTTQVTP